MYLFYNERHFFINKLVLICIKCHNKNFRRLKIQLFSQLKVVCIVSVMPMLLTNCTDTHNYLKLSKITAEDIDNTDLIIVYY